MVESLNDIQQRSIDRALNAPLHRWIFADELGCGKSRQALMVAKALEAKDILVVTPASVRPNWVAQLAQWLPEADRVGSIGFGQRKQLSKAKRAALELATVAPVRVQSYNFLGAHWLPPRAWKVIIFDEVDLFQHPHSKWSENARQLIQQNPRACVLGLTGTLMPNVPLDAWNPVDIIYPGRFGAGWRSESEDPAVLGKLHPCHKYAMRYTYAENNGYGWQFKGVNEEYNAELRERLSFFTSRITRRDIAHLLPPYQVRQVEAEEGADAVEAAVSWAQEALICSTHVFIATHFRRTVGEIARRLQSVCIKRGVGFATVTGAESAEERVAILERQRKSLRSVTVGTMHAVERGITLGWNQQILLAELYWRPATLVQFLGRAGRMGDAAGAVIDLMALPGTQSERIAFRLAQKIRDIQSTQVAGAVDTALQSALQPRDLLAMLNDMSDVPPESQDDWILSAADEDEDNQEEDIL